MNYNIIKLFSPGLLPEELAILGRLHHSVELSHGDIIQSINSQGYNITGHKVVDVIRVVENMEVHHTEYIVLPVAMKCKGRLDETHVIGA